ncbi:hypothetical protein L1987_59574 [Smallanthus sonchifolius]|uniref:Uncharacterized protein n=1 Tax=Smallanthus sonchifolius TaxID=185202 RepID=A0ACB9D6D0_9ASTR|nr:hypothetical protein L1987_59574 [Smallanthus sonchifolius]
MVTTHRIRVQNAVTWQSSQSTKDASNRQQKVKLLVSDLKQIMRIELRRRSSGETELVEHDACTKGSNGTPKKLETTLTNQVLLVSRIGHMTRCSRKKRKSEKKQFKFTIHKDENS